MTIPDRAVEAAAFEIRRHIKCDATGLNPTVASVFLTGFEEAARSALVAAEQAMWEPVESAPDGDRILLCWKAFSGISEHVELGRKRGSGFVNTYGKPFSGSPDYWMALPPPPETKK